MTHRRGRTRTRVAASLLVWLALCVLAACSTSPTSAPTAEATVAPTSTQTAQPTQSPAPPTVLPTTVPTGLPGAVSCTTSDLKASHGLVEGAAGSRLTTVVLVAANPCSVDLYPAMGLRDVHGTELVGSVAGGSGRIDLGPDASYESQIRFANWCNPDPAFPLALVIQVEGEEVAVTGSSFPEDGDMPPCNGGGGPVLEAGAWEAP